MLRGKVFSPFDDENRQRNQNVQLSCFFIGRLRFFIFSFFFKAKSTDFLSPAITWHDKQKFWKKEDKKDRFCVFGGRRQNIFSRMHKTQKNQTLSNCADESFCEEILGKQVFSSSWDSLERLIWNLSLQSNVLMRLLQKPLWFLSKNNSCTWTVTSLKRSGRSSSVWFIFELLSLASAAEVNKVSN